MSIPLTSAQIRQKYLKFFSDRGHAVIPSAPLVPENDPTTLFTSSGMQPLVPYLLGQPHPAGKRLVDSQKSFRAQDIEEVGDNRHTTFFEMLGNWSLGDYFKKEQLPWIFEFLTKELELDPNKLYITVFAGNKFVPKDTESIEIWKRLFQSVGIVAEENERIFAYPASKNWWSRSGEPENMPSGEPGGPDSEVFYDFGQERLIHENSIYKNDQCHPNCDCGRFMEIANSVFMQYQKQPDGSLSELKQKNVDFGGGLERLATVVNNNPDIFQTDLFQPIITEIQKISNKKYNEHPNLNKYFRIICDHVKAVTMLVADGVIPSNKERGYVVRRLLRRVIWYGRNYLLIPDTFTNKLVYPIVKIYKLTYPNLAQKESDIVELFEQEENKFLTTIDRGKKEMFKMAEGYMEQKIISTKDLTGIFKTLPQKVTGKLLFNIYETYGLPPDIVKEEFENQGWKFNTDLEKEFWEEKKKHQELSRTASKGMFRGGLADHSETVTKLHTATHLLHAALRKFVGNHVQQKGSNITAERLRFDFVHSAKLTEKERPEIEKWINRQIFSDLPVTKDTTTLAQAKENGALAFFGEKYGDKVTVYTIGDEKTGIVSKEVCGGPHVARTGGLGLFKLGKEETVSAGVRRVYAFLTPK